VSRLVTYAPDIVGVDRIFMVVLALPADAPEMEVTHPDSIVLFDRTPLPAKQDQRRYYFRSVKPAESAEIRFSGGEYDIRVPVTVWSYDDLREFRQLKGHQLPRRWPLGERLPSLKEGRTVYTEADIARMTGGGPGRASQWAAMSDDDIWALQPDSTIPRWHWVNVSHGCPVHGTEIYKKKAYYPWEKDTSFPYRWKIKCPVGGEEYPSNDFGAGDMTSGEFPDDGIGGAYPQGGQRYGFIAEINQAYCHEMLKVAPDCARAYIATGDKAYLHKALVAFSRLAMEYAYLATMTQHRHRNSQSQVERLGPAPFSEGPSLYGAGLTVYCIDQPGYQWNHAEAYDLIFPDIDKDEEIIPFLQGKGLDVSTHEDVRRFLEENLFAVWMQAAIDGSTHSNEPFHQRGMIRMAEVLNYPRGNEFMDWLYDGAGKMRIFVPNGFFRDGAPYESTGGYNSMHVTALGPIVESVEHLRSMRPAVYPEDRYPSLSKSVRYRNVFDFCMDTVTIDRSFPQIGDGGSHPEYRKLPKITWHDADIPAFEHAYRIFRSPKFAWALANAPGWRPSPDFPFTREEIEQQAALWPDDWNDASSLHDGYGIAILRGGKADEKRALWMRYGWARGHNQDDLMDIGLQAHEGLILGHMGYPRNWGYWEYSWSSHNLARQFPYLTQVARSELFADAGIAQVAECVAKAHNNLGSDGVRATPPEDYGQRRTLALVDVSPTEFYSVDFYDVSGGEDHWWAFHCQEGDFTTGGIELKRQDGGTLAGPDVPYGDTQWLKDHGATLNHSYGWRGVNFVFPFLYNVDKGATGDPWWANWKLKTGDGLQVRLHMVKAANGDGSPVEVNITDGKAASGGSPYEMKWLMLHAKGADPARSSFVSALETYTGEPLIASTAMLPLEAASETAKACRIALANGRVDTLVHSTDAEVACRTGDGLEFAGRFGLYAERDGVPEAMSLVGGTRIEKNGFGIQTQSGEYRGRVVSADYANQTVRIAPCPPSPGAMEGATIYFSFGPRRVAYEVVEARKVGDEAELVLYTDPRIGTGKVAAVADNKVRSATEFHLHNYGYYQGAWMVSPDGKAGYTLNDVRSGDGAYIDAEAHEGASADVLAAQFPEGSWFDIYDFGPGYDVIWPYSVSVKKTGEHTYEVCAPVPVTLTLPEGTQAVAKP